MPICQVLPASGAELTQTLTFTNDGPATAHDVVLTHVIPSELVSPTVVYTSPEVVGQRPGVRSMVLMQAH